MKEAANCAGLFECDTDPKACAPDDTARQIQSVLRGYKTKHALVGVTRAAAYSLPFHARLIDSTIPCCYWSEERTLRLSLR
jgi:hypothetical protein